MLDPELCRQRQRRLLSVMHAQSIDAVVVGRPDHVYYFTGYRPFWLHEAAFMLRDDRRRRRRRGSCAATSRTAAPAAKHVHRVRVQLARHAAAGQPACGRRAARGSRRPSTSGSTRRPVASPVAPIALAPTTSIDHLWQFRRRKDPDELALMRRAIACTEAMYRRAREIIEPGVPELRVYTELHAAAVEVAGEPLWPAYLGNDFACGAPGGPPRGGRDRAGRRAVHPRPRPRLPRLLLRQLPGVRRRPQADRRAAAGLGNRHRRLPDRRAHGQARRPLPRHLRRRRRALPAAAPASPSRTTSATASASSRTSSRT